MTAPHAPLVVDGVELPAAFYERVDENTFRSTIATQSPWDISLQHGGPPSAMLARAAEQVCAKDHMQVARIAVDFLGGIPRGIVRTEAEVVRPGKRIELIDTRLYVDDKLALRGSVWMIRVDDGLTSEFTAHLPLPEMPREQEPRYFDGVHPQWGYGRAVEWRHVAGGFDEMGASEVWGRTRIPLVEGEETSGACRMLVLADSANGLSIRLPITQWLSVPPSLTVTMQRPPAGEWMFLRSGTSIGPDGIGSTVAEIADDEGFIASVAQALVLTHR